MRHAQAFWKRALGVGGAAGGLLLLGLPMLVLAVVVRLASGAPVFFRQVRVGRGGRRFTVTKFRTMALDSEKQGPITTGADPRVTPLGRVLRRFKLDELPQLWNVLIGKMSFVGPRPDVPGYADRLEGEEREILNLRPGITGPATLFFRNEEELLARAADPQKYNDEVLWPVKVKLNLEYARNWSFWRDLGYIVVTVCPPLDRWLKVREWKVQEVQSSKFKELKGREGRRRR